MNRVVQGRVVIFEQALCIYGSHLSETQGVCRGNLNLNPALKEQSFPQVLLVATDIHRQ